MISCPFYKGCKGWIISSAAPGCIPLHVFSRLNEPHFSDIYTQPLIRAGAQRLLGMSKHIENMHFFLQAQTFSIITPFYWCHQDPLSVTNQHQRKENPGAVTLIFGESSQYKKNKANARQGKVYQGIRIATASHFLPSFQLAQGRSREESISRQTILQSLAKSCLPSKENPPFHNRSPVLLCSPANLQKARYREDTLCREFGKAELAENNFVLPSPFGHVHLVNVLLISLMLFERSSSG